MNNAYTENLSDFGYRELAMAKDLLNAMYNGLPDDFNEDGVRIAFNRNSGAVFLTNDEYEVAAMNGDDLESWYYLGYHGYEGFLDDLLWMYDNDQIESEDWEELADIAERNGKTDEAEKIRVALKEVENDD